MSDQHTAPLLEVRDLHVNYGNVPALTGLSITIPATQHRSSGASPQDRTMRGEQPGGSITGVVGMNGSGKSSFFKALMGVVPSTGTINIAGQSPRHLVRRGAIAYMPQSETVEWNFPLSVADVVMQGRIPHQGFMRRPHASDHQRVSEALDTVGLAEYADRQIGDLSGGQRKRVFLARVLAQEGVLNILDEPFAGVDRRTIQEIIGVLRRQAQAGAHILVSLHHLDTVHELCDSVILVHRKALFHGPPEQAMTPENLARVFLADSGAPA
ncbi:metal ABC transporter ATP-binding protein [Jonesia quinghaiensis]|uniref:metal ABC transporter ATP-binding protein n=1 Tax=Jonesia quinghaiensis TaxID=262806 RepID=UPI00040D772E|nr:metal ABC transporter ATP-binding protein [Jonesia quinghaiensis]